MSCAMKFRVSVYVRKLVGLLSSLFASSVALLCLKAL